MLTVSLLSRLALRVANCFYSPSDLMDQDVLSDRVDPHKALALTFKAKPKKNVVSRRAKKSYPKLKS
jgi:hypothetical protein